MILDPRRRRKQVFDERHRTAEHAEVAISTSRRGK
jgi:hypothetical protein